MCLGLFSLVLPHSVDTLGMPVLVCLFAFFFLFWKGSRTGGNGEAGKGLGRVQGGETTVGMYCMREELKNVFKIL